MIYDTIIIGSGVAGLTAALYLARANKSVMIIEDSFIGGTTATLDVIENYPGFERISGNELVSNMFMQVSKLGVNINFMSIKSINFDAKVIETNNAKFQYKTLIIASGTSVNKLNIDSEHKYLFKGLSYCAVCDGALFKNKKIVVATDGASGKDAIEYLSNITDSITIVNMSNNYNSKVFPVYNNARITQINGQNRVESIVVEQDNSDLINIECSGVFVALGKHTNLDLYKGVSCQNGYIISDENMSTNIPGVYVAGDIRYKNLRQIVTACSDGAIAATESIKLINKI